MTIKYTWSVDSLDCFPSLNNENNVVNNVNWRVIATDGIYFVTAYGAQVIPNQDKNNFIPYADLTETTIIDWVKEALGADQVASIQTSLDNQIAALINPPIVTLPLPWANNA
jgi:hypothetical protein